MKRTSRLDGSRKTTHLVEQLVEGPPLEGDVLPSENVLLPQKRAHHSDDHADVAEDLALEYKEVDRFRVPGKACILEDGSESTG